MYTLYIYRALLSPAQLYMRKYVFIANGFYLLHVFHTYKIYFLVWNDFVSLLFYPILLSFTVRDSIVLYPIRSKSYE